MRNFLTGKIKESEAGMKVKDFLKDCLKLSSRNTKRLAMDRQIFVNRKSVRLDYILKLNDEYKICLDKDEEQNILPVEMDLDIVYEDECILVVNKPAYMVVHPTKSHQEDTLTNGILHYFKTKGEKSIVRLVSRLDMNTTGLVVIAKNQFTHSYFSRIMHENGMEKEYIAIVCGHYKEKRGVINQKIYKEFEDSYRRTVDERGQESITHFEVIENLDGYSLVKFVLETGRTHQIRVHSTFLGHALVNDELYGGEIVSENPRQFLHARKICFTHPISKKNMTFTAEVPEDMKKFIEQHRIQS